MMQADTDSVPNPERDNRPQLESEWRSKSFSRLFLLVGYLLFSVGIILLLVSQLFVPDGIYRVVVTNLAAALIPAGTIIVAYEYYMRKEFLAHLMDSVERALARSDLTKRVTDLDELISLTNDLRPFGLQKVFRSRREIDIRKLVESARPKTEIKMLGTALMCVNPHDMQSVITERIKEGCTVKLLSLNPDSDFVKQRAREEHRRVIEIQRVIRNTCENNVSFIETLDKKTRQGIRLLHYDAPPICFMVSNGDTMIVSFYLREHRGEHFPYFQIEIKEGGIYEQFMEHFDSLWREVEANAPHTEEPGTVEQPHQATPD
jgi:hypothetical protein